MKSDSKDIILRLANRSSGVAPKELRDILGISQVAVHKHLRDLLSSKQIEKRGKPPRVLYFSIEDTEDTGLSLPEKYKEVLEEHYCYFTPSGKELRGSDAFYEFLKRTEQDQKPKERAREYIEIVKRAEGFRDVDGLLVGTPKIVDTFGATHLDKLYYSDFYSLPKYGKTYLGQYLLHGKSGQNEKLIRKIAEDTREDVNTIIKTHNIQAIAFAPHSIPRRIPFLDRYRKLMDIKLPEISLSKIFAGDVPIAQKSLSKLSERIENARNTIFLDENRLPYQRVLVIDDAVGSGATLNEIAKKIKDASQAKCNVYGYAIVGSYKGFEVLREV